MLKVLDPATVVVGFRGQTTVRIIGIEAPRRNPEECFGRESLQRARALLDGKRVELTFESPPRRDARGQLLAQLTLAHGRDYGVTMLDGGYAAVSSSPGLLATDYRDAMTTAKAADAGLWASCARLHTLVAPPQPDPPDEPEEPASNCDPNYSPCIPAYPPDINCPEAGPVTVTGPDDPHDLDGDGDGVACGSD